MTSEIAIMNKNAIALAADSTVTIETNLGKKTYITNKLFTLSKYQPIGIMIYGNAELMGVPWETIIKIYRIELENNKFENLNEYTKDFIEFLKRFIKENNEIFTEEIQNNYFKSMIISYFELIKRDIKKELEIILNNKGEFNDEDIKEMTKKVINMHFKELKNRNKLDTISNNLIKKLNEKIKKEIPEYIKYTFKKLSLTKKQSKQLKDISIFLFTKDLFPSNVSGIVISGFGKNDKFPKTNWFSINTIVINNLIYSNIDNIEIDVNNTAYIKPFAQKEMVHMFMEGIHPEYQTTSYKFLFEVFKDLRNIIKDKIGRNVDFEKIEDIFDKTLNIYKNKMENHIRKYHIDPIMQIISHLPKEELAELAESFIHITSIKRKYTPEVETVGGPIDVALISKGDGFIWIKRKHYFEPGLNPYFFKRYFKE
jgi:hypothetical protein